MPDRVVSEMTKTLRRGKTLIDWSQNSDFKTTVGVYAMRAKEGGPFISVPITWEELAKAVKRRKSDVLFFTPTAAVKRIKRLGDLFAPVLTLKQTLPSVFTEALAAGPPPKLSSWPRNRNKSGRDHDKSLREYAPKRDHTRTPEPAAQSTKEGARKGVHRFVFRSIRRVISITTGAWKCRASCVRGLCRKVRRPSCARRGWRCMWKIIRSNTKASRARSRRATTARDR
jgi:bifunctional non-homologous end joining protein LigD